MSRRTVRPLGLPAATAEQWEAAFRRAEVAFAPNKARRWVLQCMVHELKQIVEPSA